jgi:hypothetical protein
MLLAMGTAAMAAGMGHCALMVATLAMKNHHAAVLIAAPPHRLQGTVMAGQQFVAVVMFQIAAVAIDQIR